MEDLKLFVPRVQLKPETLVYYHNDEGTEDGITRSPVFNTFQEAVKFFQTCNYPKIICDEGYMKSNFGEKKSIDKCVKVAYRDGNIVQPEQ